MVRISNIPLVLTLAAQPSPSFPKPPKRVAEHLDHTLTHLPASRAFARRPRSPTTRTPQDSTKTQDLLHASGLRPRSVDSTDAITMPNGARATISPEFPCSIRFISLTHCFRQEPICPRTPRLRQKLPTSPIHLPLSPSPRIFSHPLVCLLTQRFFACSPRK